MGSKSLTNVVTQNSIALNAYIYGYALLATPAFAVHLLTAQAMLAIHWSPLMPRSSSSGGPRSALMPK